MFLNEEEFNGQFTEAIDGVIEAMAEAPEIEPGQFFNMVCVLENLQFFAPVIYGAIRNGTSPNPAGLETPGLNS